MSPGESSVRCSGWRSVPLARLARPAAPSATLPHCVEAQLRRLVGLASLPVAGVRRVRCWTQRLDRKMAIEQEETQNSGGPRT